MKSFFYLASRKAKNRILEITKRPSELIMLLIFSALVGVSVFGGAESHSAVVFHRDINELYAIVLALYAFVFVMTAKNGFINGASMFSMADVNLIFTSPRKPKSVLTYGLLGQMGRSLFLGVFILYQYSWAHDSYGVGYDFLLAVLIGYGAVVFLSQMLAMLIYCVTSNSDKLCSLVKAVFYTLIGAFVVYVAFSAYNGEDYLSGAVSAADSVVLKFFPVAGFVQLGVVGFAEGKLFLLAISVSCFLLFCGGYYLLITLLNPDFYEDVLKATEVSFSAITARKEGKAIENSPRNTKIGKTGIKKGQGASTIYFKHKVENRRGKIFFLDTVSLVTAIITIGFSFFTKMSFAGFVFNIYMSVFTVGSGRWAKELILPYIYLIPEPPFKKLINALKEQIPSLIVESIITFVPLYFLGLSSVEEILGYVISKISFSFLFIAINLMFHRFFGGRKNKTLTVMLYMFAATLFSVPFACVFAVFNAVFYFSFFVSLLSASAINIIISLILIYICRNILQYAQYNNK